MLGQILLTVAVVLIAYLVIRSRRVTAPARTAPDKGRRIPPGFVRILANGLIALMVLGSLFYLIDQWWRDREVVTVEVINTNTGRVGQFQARRGDVDGRTFVTLDGQQIRLADVERMILREGGPSPHGQGPDER